MRSDPDLDARFPQHAPFVESEALPPFRSHRGREALAITGSPARIRAWLDGWRLAEGSPLRPRVIDATEDAILLEPIGAPADPRPVLLAEPRGVTRIEGSRRDALGALDAELNLPRALGRVGLPRRLVDRYLDARIDALLETLPVGFGGLAPHEWRSAGARVVALRMDRARRDGWLALELAALEVEGDGEAFELARVALALRRAVLAADPGLARDVVAAIVSGSPEPERVRVWIEGPELAHGLWEEEGATVDARRARWLMQHLDGLAVAGDHLRVRVEPALRAGRRPPRREPRAARQRRLFSRWAEGIQVDDEGLVGLTPEALALRIAGRARGIVIDGTCGVGGLAIALARTPGVERVIAVDVSAERLAMAAHNAGIYGVRERIDFVRGDVLGVLATRAADVLVLDPPWGGRGYDRERVGLEALGRDAGLDVGATLAAFRGPVLLKLPRSFDPATLPSGPWTLTLLLDEREIPKLLLAERARSRT